MLHLIFQRPSDADLLQRIGFGDTVVFFGSASLSLLKLGKMAPELKRIANDGAQFYALSDDMAVHGIDANDLLKEVVLIDYYQLVNLTIQHSPVCSW